MLMCLFYGLKGTYRNPTAGGEGTSWISLIGWCMCVCWTETGLGGMELSSGERAKALARVRANQWVRGKWGVPRRGNHSRPHRVEPGTLGVPGMTWHGHLVFGTFCKGFKGTHRHANCSRNCQSIKRNIIPQIRLSSFRRISPHFALALHTNNISCSFRLFYFIYFFPQHCSIHRRYILDISISFPT